MRDLVRFYKVYRAYVRGKVTSFRLDSQDPIAQKEALLTAQRYFSLAASYVQEEKATHTVATDRPKLIIACGLWGTGKTTIAKEVAEANGWAIVSSDAVRKEIAGIPAAQHEYIPFREGIYSDEFSEKTYGKMNEIAQKLLEEGRSVVVDASYGKKSQRVNVHALAKAIGAEFTCVELVCPESEIKRRLTARMHEEGAISDGRWEIFPKHKASFEKVDEFTEEEHVVVDTSKPIEESVKELAEHLRVGNVRGAGSARTE